MLRVSMIAAFTLLFVPNALGGEKECVGAIVNTFAKDDGSGQQNTVGYSPERHTKGLKRFFQSRRLPILDEGQVDLLIEREQLSLDPQRVLQVNPWISWILVVTPDPESSQVALTTKTATLYLNIETGKWDDSLRLFALVVQRSCNMPMQDLVKTSVQESPVRSSSIPQKLRSEDIVCLEDADCPGVSCVNSVCDLPKPMVTEVSEPVAESGAIYPQIYVGPHILGKAFGGTLGVSFMGETLGLTTELHISRLHVDSTDFTASATYFGGRIMLGIGIINEDTDHFLFSAGINVGRASFDSRFGEEAFGISESVVGLPLQLRGNLGYFYTHFTVDPLNNHFFLGVGVGN